MTTQSNRPAADATTEKEPKGSKLDAKKRIEYFSDVAGASGWDTSTWPTWTVTGRVLPERCFVNVAAVLFHGNGAGGRFKGILQVVQSHIVVTCAFEKGDPSISEIADTARTGLAFPVDYIAFQNRGAYEIVLDLCINNRTGQVAPIPIFEPIFETSDASLCFDPLTDKSNLRMPWAAAAVPELPTAIHDLTSAVRYPRRTFEYCRMAVEVVRRHFDPPTVKGHDKRHPQGEKAMCTALRIERNSLKALDRIAARSRHGELIFSISWETRRAALEFAWELVARFIAHLENASRPDWRLLDVRFED
jgi:hypothetical protein